MKIAVYPGRFDPLTNGHLAVIKKALADFDLIYVVIMENPEKSCYFSIKTRLKMLESIASSQIKIDYWPGWATQYCLDQKATHLIRGYRNQVDFAYEKIKKARYNKQNKAIKILLYQVASKVSSTTVRQLFENKGNFSPLVPWKKELVWTKED